MPRYIRNSAILAKVETVYGTDPTPTPAENAILVSNININPVVAKNVDRALERPYFGGSEQLVGVRYVELNFDVELQSSGSMVTPTLPAWGALARACAMAETGTAGSRVEYNPISAAFESCTIYYYLDGVLRKLLGCRGNMVIKLGMGDRSLLSFAFKGIDGGISAVSLPSLTLTDWKVPLPVNDPNTGDITLGCTYTAATPALTGGTGYPSRGIEIDLGNQVEHVPLLGGESIDIVNRDATAKFALDLTAANEVTFNAAVLANTLQSLGVQHGTAAGYKALVYAAQMQMINPKYEDFQGRALMAFDGRLLPTSGNDEIKLVAA